MSTAAIWTLRRGMRGLFLLADILSVMLYFQFLINVLYGT